MSVKEKIKRIASNTFSQVKNNVTLTVTLLIALVLFIVLLTCTIGDLIARFSHEFKEVANWDSYLYYTVGHALSEGLSPYADMYENKPPMIFLLSSISYNLFGNYRLINILSFLSLFVLLFVPTAFCITQIIKNKTELGKSVYLCLFTFASSIAIVFFSQENATEAQLELLGSAFAVLSVFLISFVDANKVKFYSPLIIFSGICFGISTMFKEPFALVCGVSLLFFCKDLKELLYRVVLPVCYAIITALLILAFSNCFVPYFTIYLKNMFSSHISIYGSPFERMKNVEYIFSYSYNFLKVLPLIYFILIFFTSYSEVKTRYSNNLAIDILFKCIGFAKPIIFLYVISFVVGLGGQYYNHHYVFAVPYFVSMMFITCRFLSKSKTPFFTKIYQKEIDTFGEIKNQEKTTLKILKSFAIYPLVALFIVISLISFDKINPSVMDNFANVQAETLRTKDKAEYIDEVLDCLGEENYLWIGFNGYCPFAYTKHLPLGPSFAQDVNNFQSADTFFAKAFISQLESANVVVLKDLSFNLGAVSEQTRQYIINNFTLNMPSKLQQSTVKVPDNFEWLIVYRNYRF